MNIVITIILWVLVFVGAATIGDVNIPVVFDTTFASPILMACADLVIRGITTIVFLVPALLFGLFWTFVLIFLAALADYDTTEEETKGLMIVLSVIILAPLMIFAHPYIMTAWVFDGAEWATQFSYWQYTFVSGVILLFNWKNVKTTITTVNEKA